MCVEVKEPGLDPDFATILTSDRMVAKSEDNVYPGDQLGHFEMSTVCGDVYSPQGGTIADLPGRDSKALSEHFWRKDVVGNK